MDEPGFFSEQRIAIIGLGLMGGSLAMALKGKCAWLAGVDRNPETLALAREWELADQLSDRLEDVIPQAGLIILATPVRAILSLLGELPRFHPGRAVVLDLGSTKTGILAAMDGLPEALDPVGGHPMCGKEHASLANAEAGLYRGAPFALVPLPRTSPDARDVVEALVRAVGARPVWLAPEQHDHWVASTSHLPYLVSNTLARITPAQVAPMVGTGFRSASRLAPTPLTVMSDILRTNRPHVLASLREMQDALAEVERCLADQDWDQLEALLARGGEAYREIIKRADRE